jgi:ABC-type multidrug transport system fused ATPase/permease subunit
MSERGATRVAGLKESILIARASSLITPRAFGVLAFYYAVAVLKAVIGAGSMLLLVDLVIGRAGRSDATFATRGAGRLAMAVGAPAGVTGLAIILIVALLVGVISTFIYYSIDGYLEASLRRRVQERGFAAVLHGDWERLRDMRVGERVGAVTEESTNVARYFMALIRGSYNVLAMVVFLVAALAVSARVSIVVALAGVPVLIAIKYLFTWQARLAEQMVVERQGFYADVTERLSGLFQIKVEGKAAHHVTAGLRTQKALTEAEIEWWRLRAGINALNVFLPAVVVGALYAWSLIIGTPMQSLLQLLAGIGVVGTQALSQANQFTSNLGNVTAYAGSVGPVYDLFSITPEVWRPEVPERVTRIELKDVSYAYSDRSGVKCVSLSFGVGNPLLLMGPSGSGKTTLANVVAGLYRPTKGRVSYVGESGRVYDALDSRPRVGYVPQDILLFQGTVRENLTGGQGSVADDVLLDSLRGAGAELFIARLGGLDAVIVEGGRSLSGGERRRLGIARVLAGRPDVLIFDEVTVGLDEERKLELLATIGALSERFVVVAITHDSDVAGAARFNIVRLAA